MTTPTEAIRAALVSFAGIQSLLAQGTSPETYRVYNMAMPQDSDMPTVVMGKAAQTREATLAPSGGNGVENQRCRFSCWAETLLESEAVAEQIRLALAAAQATNFTAVQVFNTDDYEDDTHLYRVIVDYSIWYRH